MRAVSSAPTSPLKSVSSSRKTFSNSVAASMRPTAAPTAGPTTGTTWPAPNPSAAPWLAPPIASAPTCPHSSSPNSFSHRDRENSPAPTMPIPAPMLGKLFNAYFPAPLMSVLGSPRFAHAACSAAVNPSDTWGGIWGLDGVFAHGGRGRSVTPVYGAARIGVFAHGGRGNSAEEKPARGAALPDHGGRGGKPVAAGSGGGIGHTRPVHGRYGGRGSGGRGPRR